jgi:hypothetical protein
VTVLGADGRRRSAHSCSLPPLYLQGKSTKYPSGTSFNVSQTVRVSVCPEAVRVSVCPETVRVSVCPKAVRVSVCPKAVRVSVCPKAVGKNKINFSVSNGNRVPVLRSSGPYP